MKYRFIISQINLFKRKSVLVSLKWSEREREREREREKEREFKEICVSVARKLYVLP